MKPNQKFFAQLILLFAIDVIVMMAWMFRMGPDPSAALELIILLPFVFCLNLLTAGVLFAFKKNKVARLFLINSILASVACYYSFAKAVDHNLYNTLERWQFKKGDTTFSITRMKQTKDFDMGYSNTPGIYNQFLQGTWRFKNGDYILTTDSTRYIIQKGKYLIGFRKPTDTLKLEEQQ